jgi:hypothetical protein
VSRLEKPRPASDFEAEPIEWLRGWEGRFPKGTVIGLIGHPDLGKTLFTLYVAAEGSKRGETVIVSNVDHPNQMTRPRLEAAGADLDRVHLWTPRSFPQLPDEMVRVREIIFEDGVTLCALDPARLHWRVPFRNGHALRAKILDPLHDLAAG